MMWAGPHGPYCAHKYCGHIYSLTQPLGVHSLAVNMSSEGTTKADQLHTCACGRPTHGTESRHGESQRQLSGIRHETPPTVLTVQEAAVLLRVNRKSVYEAIMLGKLPGVRRIGKSIRLNRQVLLDWLAAGRAGRGRP
jgi:excisionase family DNA binding protein